MGDACDMSDIERFMRSTEGRERLEETRKMLLGHRIEEVSFTNETHCIATEVHLDDGTVFVVFQPSLEVDALREEFHDVIEAEYFKDYPERRPTNIPSQENCAE